MSLIETEPNSDGEMLSERKLAELVGLNPVKLGRLRKTYGLFPSATTDVKTKGVFYDSKGVCKVAAAAFLFNSGHKNKEIGYHLGRGWEERFKEEIVEAVGEAFYFKAFPHLKQG